MSSEKYIEQLEALTDMLFEDDETHQLGCCIKMLTIMSANVNQRYLLTVHELLHQLMPACLLDMADQSASAGNLRSAIHLTQDAQDSVRLMGIVDHERAEREPAASEMEEMLRQLLGAIDEDGD